MRKSILTFLTAGIMAVSMSITSWAMTAEEVTAKNPTSYTAGTQSIYGPSLTQDQLNAVAQATADFMSNNITDSMDTDAKIKAAYDYIKNRTTYVNWDAVTGANTAYTLVTGQGACSGMCRSMKALCDAMGIECYHVHSTSNDHQWNLVRFGDGVLYHVDIDANKSAGQDIIYKSLTHPLPFDTSAYPAVGAAQAVSDGWKQENGKWYYYENENKAVNKWINGIYYVGSDGAMLTNTTTPDGYQVGADGAWIEEIALEENSLHNKALDDSDAILVNSLDAIEHRIDTNGNPYIVLAESTTTIKWLSTKSNIKPDNLRISYAVYKYNPSTNTIYPFSNDGTALYEDFQYDKEYDIKINEVDLRGSALVNYCKQKNIVIAINVFNPLNNDALGNMVCYK